MQNLTKVVVVVSKTLIRAAQVEGENIIDPIEMDWQPELLRKALRVIKDRYQATRIRVVMDEDVSHTFELEIPASVMPAEERQVVEAKMRTQIPEVVAADNWDYKIKSADETSKLVTVYVPVQEVYLAFTDAASKEGIEIEATEPVSIALTRHSNPFVGMAMKTDLRGDDEQVLNVQPLYKVEEATGTLETVTAPVAKKGMNKVLILTVGLLLFGLLAYGIVKAVRNTPRFAPASPSPAPSVVVATPEPSPTPAPVDLSSLKVKVLNGSGVPGQAGVVAKLLESSGFATPDTANAKTYDYTETVVQFKPSVYESAYPVVTKALQPDYAMKKGTALDETDDYDVIVTVGKKASVLGESTVASPTPKPSVKPSVIPSVSPRPSSAASPAPSGSASPSPSSSPSVSPSHSPSPSPSAT